MWVGHARTAVERLQHYAGLGLEGDDLEAALGRHLDDAVAHQAAADDTHFLDLIRHCARSFRDTR